MPETLLDFDHCGKCGAVIDPSEGPVVSNQGVRCHACWWARLQATTAPHVP